jgi:hypothetical protein
MQQRRLRLGDILDDYCPRERRLTNHVIVAMIGDAVKQTRCTTCDADHDYKHAALPRPRKKSEESALYSQVLAAVTPKRIVPPGPAQESVATAPAFVAAPAAPAAAPVSPAASDFDALFDLPEDPDGNEAPVEEGPAHRRLIAQLPKHEGRPDSRDRRPTSPSGNRIPVVRSASAPARGGAQFRGPSRWRGTATGTATERRSGSGSGRAAAGCSAGQRPAWRRRTQPPEVGAAVRASPSSPLRFDESPLTTITSNKSDLSHV